MLRWAMERKPQIKNNNWSLKMAVFLSNCWTIWEKDGSTYWAQQLLLCHVMVHTFFNKESDRISLYSWLLMFPNLQFYGYGMTMN